MSFYNTLNRSLIAPASDLLLGRSIFEKLKFLEESQWWDWDTIEAYQNDRLRKMISHCYSGIHFYTDLWNSHGITMSQIQTSDDLKKLPVVQKKDIRKIAASRSHRKKRVVPGVSSGSTGEPLQYSKSVEAYSMHTATALRGWQWMGFNLGDRYMKISQNPRKGIFKKAQDLINRSQYVFLKDISETEFEKLYREICKRKPKFLRCYPDPLLFFSRFIQNKGYELPLIKAINTTGNILTQEARREIESALNSTIYDAYSCEGGAVFYQTDEGPDYIGADEYAVTEIVDENGDEVQPGEKGRMVTTDLWNTETPFIRYDTQDIVTKATESDLYSRQSTRLQSVAGRDCDILITPDGKLVIVHIFTIFFEWYHSVEQFQAIQKTETRFRILLVVNEQFSKKDREEIEMYWKEYFGKKAEVIIEITDEIPPRRTGKRRFLVRDEKIPLPF
jgi:phenylacetate-CoA ligase